ncbi:hypothetical protein HYFRA_00011505 [Hymenoscyphus fraxineus]|uniref:Uncharacterized protein n=1 Tax=Hymenoscyphus fraxineus TaxID=746836 RepID=A0A9N9L383_9HELO|nr:hypothetical protein HYFRA_00011505 [Hymenoscyphus fraxineus]
MKEESSTDNRYLGIFTAELQLCLKSLSLNPQQILNLKPLELFNDTMANSSPQKDLYKSPLRDNLLTFIFSPKFCQRPKILNGPDSPGWDEVIQAPNSAASNYNHFFYLIDIFHDNPEINTRYTSRIRFTSYAREMKPNGLEPEHPNVNWGNNWGPCGSWSDYTLTIDFTYDGEDVTSWEWQRKTEFIREVLRLYFEREQDVGSWKRIRYSPDTRDGAPYGCNVKERVE